MSTPFSALPAVAQTFILHSGYLLDPSKVLNVPISISKLVQPATSNPVFSGLSLVDVKASLGAFGSDCVTYNYLTGTVIFKPYFFDTYHNNLPCFTNELADAKAIAKVVIDHALGQIGITEILAQLPSVVAQQLWTDPSNIIRVNVAMSYLISYGYLTNIPLSGGGTYTYNQVCETPTTFQFVYPTA